MSLETAIITLILVMDPFGNIPIFLSLLEKYDPPVRRKILIREMLIALVVLTLFLFSGKYILEGLNLSAAALTIGGGVILFLVSLNMVFPKEEKDSLREEEPMVVPLAVPLIAGPSAMALVILFSTKYPGKTLLWFTALLSAWTVTFIVLGAAAFLNKLLGKKVIFAIKKLMGMILIIMSIQMLLNGLEAYLLK